MKIIKTLKSNARTDVDGKHVVSHFYRNEFGEKAAAYYTCHTLEAAKNLVEFINSVAVKDE